MSFFDEEAPPTPTVKDQIGPWAREYRQGLAPTALALNRIGAALERIADAFAPAAESVNTPPSQPDVRGVQIAED